MCMIIHIMIISDAICAMHIVHGSMWQGAPLGAGTDGGVIVIIHHNYQIYHTCISYIHHVYDTPPGAGTDGGEHFLLLSHCY